MVNDQRFRKSERLCRKKLIEELFQSGKSFYSYPFRIVWLPVGDQINQAAQIAISVKKRNFKKAVHRNLIKRRIREAYRKNKSDLYIKLESKDIHIVFILIYAAQNIMSYKEIEEKIIIVLQRLRDELDKRINEGA